MESRLLRLSAIVLVSLLVAITLVLAACGGGSKNAATSNSSKTAVTATTPKYGGTLRIAAQSIGANIGWPATISNGGGDQLQCYYETLLRSDEKGQLTGWLAKTFDVAKDHKSITFTIRQGVKFSDGSDLTADVVKWNLQQYAKTQMKWGTIEVTSPDTVRVNFTSWDNSLPASFGDSSSGLYMVSETAYKKYGQTWITTHPVGTGPFKVASYATDSSLNMVKNPYYWQTDAHGGKLPYLDGVNYTFTSDPATTLMKAQSGEIDMVTSISPGKQLKDYAQMGWRTNSTADANEVLVPDSAHPDSPWSKLEVREAAEYAIDRATIAKQFGYGYLQVPTQIPPRSTTAYDPNYVGRSYDPAKAKQLLAQAGYPTGFKTTLIVWPAGDKSIALVEQQYLAAVGIQATVEMANASKWVSYVGPQGSWHNALLEMPDAAQGRTGLGCVTFALALFGKNWQQPAQLLQAFGAATSAPESTPSLVRAATDIISQNALIIPVYEKGGARAEKPYVVADFGHRGLMFSSLETAWLNK
jgi:peptide/nickel transport system substrate-binding protein